MTCSTVTELLSAYERSELTPSERRAIEEHLEACADCRRKLEEFECLTTLCRNDQRPELGETRAFDVLSAVKNEVRSERELALGTNEIMTLEEVAAYLQVALDDLEVELETLPVFDIGGKLRVRRCRLTEWIEERERRARSRRALSLIHQA